MKPFAKKDNREADILRTAEALARVIRAEHREKWVNHKRVPLVVKILNEAALAVGDGLTADEFHKLYILSRFGSGTADNITVANDIAAVLVRSDVRSWQRATQKLEKKGWITKDKTFKSGKQSVNRYELSSPLGMVGSTTSKNDAASNAFTPVESASTENWGGSTRPFRDGWLNHPFKESKEGKDKRVKEDGSYYGGGGYLTEQALSIVGVL